MKDYIIFKTCECPYFCRSLVINLKNFMTAFTTVGSDVGFVLISTAFLPFSIVFHLVIASFIYCYYYYSHLL